MRDTVSYYAKLMAGAAFLAVAGPAIGLGIGLLLIGPAWPHTTASGMVFDAYCCNGNKVDGDCQPIPDRAVKPVKGGLQISLMPGDHPMVTKPHVFFIEQAKVRPSTDGRYYACLYPTEDNLRCLYGPPFGS